MFDLLDTRLRAQDSEAKGTNRVAKCSLVSVRAQSIKVLSGRQFSVDKPSQPRVVIKQSSSLFRDLCGVSLGMLLWRIDGQVENVLAKQHFTHGIPGESAE